MADTRKLPRSTRRPVRHKTDGWENVFTGLGKVGKDKRLGGSFCADLITQEFAEELWRGDHLMAKAVETVPAEMLREGFSVAVQGDKELSEDMDAAHRDLQTEETAQEVLEYARAYGGGAALLGTNNGVDDLAKPLDEKRILSLDFLSTRTPRELQPVSWYSNYRKARYGDVATYRLCPLDTPPGAGIELPIVHESRVLRVNGIKTSRRMRLTNTQPGWDDSIFGRMRQIVVDFQSAYQGAGILTVDFSTPVLKIKKLAQVLGSQNASAQTIQQRAGALEICRSIARVLILDSEEEYERKAVPVTGLAELLDRLAQMLSSAIDMPLSLLLGQAPAGLNATGDSDIRWFYDRVAALRRKRLKPILHRITKLIFLSKKGPTGGTEPDNWDIKFPPLWQVTEKERAEARFIQAQADQIYIVNGAVTAKEIGQSRFGGDEYSFETQIDPEVRDVITPEDEAVALGAGAAEDKERSQALEEQKAKNPAPVVRGAGEASAAK